jgi:hypothetical protein
VRALVTEKESDKGYITLMAIASFMLDDGNVLKGDEKG